MSTTREKLENLRAFIFMHEDLWSSLGQRLTRSSAAGQALLKVFASFDRWLPTFEERYSLASYIKDPFDPDIEEILIVPATQRLSETRSLAERLGLPVPPLPPRSKSSVSGSSWRDDSARLNAPASPYCATYILKGVWSRIGFDDVRQAMRWWGALEFMEDQPSYATLFDNDTDGTVGKRIREYWPSMSGRKAATVSKGVSMTPPKSFLACCNACLTDEGELLVSCELPDGQYFERAVQLRPIAERIKQMIRHYHANVLHGDMQEETVSGIGDWYHASVSAAARIANSKAVNQMWSEVKAHHGAIELGLSLVPGGQPLAGAMKTGMAVHNMVSKAKSGDPVAAHDIATIVMLAEKGDPKAAKVTTMMKTMNHMINTKDAKLETEARVGLRNPFHRRKKHRRSRDEDQDYTPQDSSPGSQSNPDSGDSYGDDPRQEQMGGWLFNRPYRLLAITPGLALRGLYNLGLAT